jgi:hypothetical protein
MSFVGPTFRHDIFVSYSHGDVDEDGESLLKQWSLAFVRELERELQAFDDLGPHIRIFVDQGHRPGHHLDPMVPLTDGLLVEIAHSAILTILMTPTYLGSAWCRQELDWWLRSQGPHQLGHEGRIAVARVWPTGAEVWPQGLLDREGHELVGHFFYNRTTSAIRPQPYSWPMVTSKTVGAFRDALLDFVGNIRVRLLKVKGELEDRLRAEEDKRRLAAHSGQVIYLHGRESQSKQWDRVNRDLEDEGYIVLPLVPEPLESDPRRMRAAQQNRIDTMSGCEALMLLGTEDMGALSADLVVIGRLDRHQAVARSNRILPCGVADTVGALKHAPQWSRKAAHLGIDWFDASKTGWTPQIRDWLQAAAT